MTRILRFHTEIGKMQVVLDPCPWPWPRLACPWLWPWPRLVCPWPWSRKNFEVLGLGLDLKVLDLTTTLLVNITSHAIWTSKRKVDRATPSKIIVQHRTFFFISDLRFQIRCLIFAAH